MNATLLSAGIRSRLLHDACHEHVSRSTARRQKTVQLGHGPPTSRRCTDSHSPIVNGPKFGRKNV